VRNEFAKMRHLRVGLLAAVLAIGVFVVTAATGLTNPSFDTATPDSWNALLGSMASGVGLVAPLVLAVLASRQVDVEHRGSGWLLAATAGVTGGQLCRAKLVTLAIVVTAATVAASAAMAGLGLLVGVTAPVPLGRWLGFTAAVVTVNLVVLAVQVLLSAHVENQLVGIGVGLLGTILALFGASVPTWLTHLTPWGYYSLSRPAAYHGHDLVAVSPWYGSIAALAVVAAVGVVVITARLDRQEA